MCKIGFDVDGVLYPWHEVIYDHARGELRMDVSREEFWSAIAENRYAEIFISNLVKNPTFYSKRLPDPSIREMLWKLSKNNTIYYLTQRPEEARITTLFWFKSSGFPQIENLTVITNGSKLPYVLKHELDYFVEDRIKNALELRNHTKVILVKQLWNQLIRDDFTCIDTVLDFPAVLERLEEERNGN